MALDTFNTYLFVSAGEQSNKFLTPTYSGGIAKFQTQRAQALSKLLVQIDPVQDLNGQANPYPGGRGKNLLNYTPSSGSGNDVTWTVNGGVVTLSGTASANVDAAEIADTSESGIFNVAGSYILSGCPSDGSSTTYYLGIHIYDGTTNRYINDLGTGESFTLAEGERITRVYIAVKSGVNVSGKTFMPMIRKSTETDATYAPYENICPISGWTGMTVTVQSGETQNEYTVTWETEVGTVYGGTLDVISGVLTVNSFLLTLSDTITPTVTVSDYSYATNPSRWQIPIGSSAYSEYRVDGNRLDASICDGLRYNSAGISTLAEGDFRFSGVQSGGYRLLQFCPSGMPATLVDLKAELVAHPLHFVLPLATPQTYQLTPTDVQTLAGFNQIYSDAGPVIDIQF